MRRVPAPRSCAVVAALAVSAIGLSAAATDLTGKVVVGDEFLEALAEAEKAEAKSRESCYWNEPNGLIPVRPPLVDPSADLGVALYREGAPASEPDELFTVKVRAGSLERSLVLTRPGSTIRFDNVSPFDHELYVPGFDGFEPQRQARGNFRPIAFGEEKSYEVRCKLMSHFRGWVVATPATVIVDLKKNGAFGVEDLEPGNYKLKVFHGGRCVHEQDVEVADAKRMEIEVKLAAPEPSEGSEQRGEEGEQGGDESENKAGEKAEGGE
jgi:hypothetical protein